MIGNDVTLTLRERAFRPFFRPFVKMLANKKNLEVFENYPAHFFSGLSNNGYRVIGRLFFGLPNEENAGVAECGGKNVLFCYDYYARGPLGPTVCSAKDIRAGYGVLLIERAYNTTPQEDEIYSEISGNRSNLYCLRERHSYRVLLDDRKTPAQYSCEGRLKVIDRLGPRGIKEVSKFSFLISVNPVTDFSMGLKSLGSELYTIALFTPDFDFSEVREELTGFDMVICGDSVSEFFDYPLRRFETFSNISQSYQILERALEEMLPKDRNAYLQLFGEKKYTPSLFLNDLSRSQVVLICAGERDEWPSVNSSFQDYVEELSSIVLHVYISDSVFYRYKSLVMNLEHSLVSFINAASYDGVRFDIHTVCEMDEGAI